MDLGSIFTADNFYTLGMLAGAFLLGGATAARAELRKIVSEEVTKAVAAKVDPIAEKLAAVETEVHELRALVPAEGGA